MIKLKLAFKVNYCQEETIFLSLHLLTASGLAATVSLTVKGLCWGNNGLVVVGLSDNNGDERTGGESYLSGPESNNIPTLNKTDVIGRTVVCVVKQLLLGMRC